MAVLALVAYLVAGRVAMGYFQRDRGISFFRVLRARLGHLAVPLFLLTIPVLWAPNCDYARGLLFFVLFPCTTVVFATAVAFLWSALRWKYSYFVLAGVAIVILGPLFDIGFHPQFYTYNHVFGGILGPLYDEELVIRPGLFWFRMLTLMWAFLLIRVGTLVRREGSFDVRMLIAVLGVGTMYFFSPWLGLNTPEWLIQRDLSGHRATEHFDLFFDPLRSDSIDVELWAIEHEYRYEQLRQKLETDVIGRIQSFIYPDAERRASLTGARVTSIAPVWLRTPQVHVLADQIYQIFPHELAHVFSREFGLPLIRASVSVGLVEGLAEATEPPLGRPSNHEMVASSNLFHELEEGEFIRRLGRTLSVSGFWTGRSTVSYTVSGSFVRFLLDTYGPGLLKEAYAAASFSRVYGKSVADLSAEWISYLNSLPSIDRAAAYRANTLFSVPSLFEKDCPHWTPRPVRILRTAVHVSEAGDEQRAYEMLSALTHKYPSYQTAWPIWGRAAMNRGEAAQVVERITKEVTDSLSADVESTLATALSLVGSSTISRNRFKQILDRYPSYARESRATIILFGLTADSPDIVSQLISDDSMHVRRRRLESILVDKEIGTNHVSEVGHLWRGRMLAAENSYGEAFSSVERVLSVLGGPCDVRAHRELGLRCLVWATEYAYRSGDLEPASAFADRAIAAHDLVGDFSMSRALIDLRGRITWVRNRTDHPLD